ncbi:hypothetical protein AG1IA_06174 [Rhizoctonia solani AG-1 IA]|uniref:Uncharacterized protein n=1 Tax=Thanatephorus cucumeris (strain AG1-IA) TaxID=983506 RepID=L8WTZ8_THACA|nr:hypothetical protein AG1IA_06174 [Rhizoctonia solani AG-1 IA]
MMITRMCLVIVNWTRSSVHPSLTFSLSERYMIYLPGSLWRTESSIEGCNKLQYTNLGLYGPYIIVYRPPS